MNNTSSAKFRCFITVFCLSTAIIIMGKIGLSKLIPPCFRSIPQKFYYNKTGQKADFDMVTVGDSFVTVGISPKAMSKTLEGKKIFNMGFGGLGLYKDSLERAADKLDKKGDKIMLIGYTPRSLSRFAKLQSKDRYDKFFSKTLIQTIDPFLNPWIEFMFSGESTVIFTKYLISFNSFKYARIIYPNADGWLEGDSIAPYKIKSIEEHRKNIKEFQKFIVDNDIIKESLETVQQLCEKGIICFGFRPPASKEYEYAVNEFCGFDQENFVKLFEKAGSQWIELDNRYDYKTYDGEHLNSASARKFSINLAKELKKRLALPEMSTE